MKGAFEVKGLRAKQRELEKELENLFGSLILRLVPTRSIGTRSGQVQRAFKGELVQ